MTEVIAEAGSNHNGSVERARDLVDVARRAGADSVKFQFIFPDGLYVPEIYDGVGYRPNPAFRQREKEALTREEWRDVWNYARDRGIAASASVFDRQGVELLAELGAPYVKIASTDLTNLELIGLACEAFANVVVSTGMASLAEVDRTYRFVIGNFPDVELALMHCVSVYPCPLPQANVRRLRVLSEAFACRIGYSDHTLGSEAAAVAVAHGASIVEKHFTVDRSLPGFDHAHALEESGLVGFVRTVKEVSEMMASSAGMESKGEDTTRKRARRAVYAARDLPAGHELSRNDLLYVRPGAEVDVTPGDLVGAVLETPVRRYQALGRGRSASGAASYSTEARDYWEKEMREKGLSEP